MDGECLLVQRETKLGAPVLGLPSSCITMFLPLLVLCWLPQVGTEDKEVEEEEPWMRLPEPFTETRMGLRMLVGVSPVLPSIKALKSS